jgi:plasmid stabilization system protein ParE
MCWTNWNAKPENRRCSTRSFSRHRPTPIYAPLITTFVVVAPQAAREWIRRARQSLKTLSQHPERCLLAPESPSFDQPIRELLFGGGNRGTYRFLFVVEGKSVYIVHLRHGSMLPLSPEE